MAKYRIYEIAKELNTDSKKVMNFLSEHKITVKSQLSSVEEDVHSLIINNLKDHAAKTAAPKPAEKSAAPVKPAAVRPAQNPRPAAPPPLKSSGMRPPWTGETVRTTITTTVLPAPKTAVTETGAVSATMTGITTAPTAIVRVHPASIRLGAIGITVRAKIMAPVPAMVPVLTTVRAAMAILAAITGASKRTTGRAVTTRTAITSTGNRAMVPRIMQLNRQLRWE